MVLLHGGLFDIDLQFGELLPSLAATRQVIADGFQGHGRTNDIDRPLICADLASDVVGLGHLGVPWADVFGFSVGGGVALRLAIRHPELIRKAIVSSVSFHRDGDRPENTEAVGAMTVAMIAGTPMEESYRANSPYPDRLQDLLDELGTFDHGFSGWSDDDIRGVAAPTLSTVGDCDAIRLDHARRAVLQLRGGDVTATSSGCPPQRFALGRHRPTRPPVRWYRPRCARQAKRTNQRGGSRGGVCLRRTWRLFTAVNLPEPRTRRDRSTRTPRRLPHVVELLSRASTGRGWHGHSSSPAPASTR